MGLPETIEALGARYPTALPNFAAREEVVGAWSEYAASGDQRIMRVAGAVIGLCCPSISTKAGTSYGKAGFSVLQFGGAVYSYLREQGMQPNDVVSLASPLCSALAEELAPRESEVEEKAGFTRAAGEA